MGRTGRRSGRGLSTVYVIWGSTHLFIALAVKTVDPLFAASTRFLLAGTIMAGLVVLRGAAGMSFRSLASCGLIGILLPGANAILFYAERNVPIGLASLIIASVPLWVVVLRLVGRERLPLPVLIGVGVGFAGVAVLARPSGGATSWGIGLCVLSAAMWAHGLGALPRLPLPADRSRRPPTRCWAAAS